MRGTTTWICGVLVLGATLGAARGQDGPWPTEWRVEGTDAARTLAPGPDGGVRLALAVGREEAAVVGPAPGGATLRLEGELARSPGLAGALEGRAARGPARVSVIVTRGQPAEDGAERADAEVRVEGRVAARERWTAPGAPGLEVVRVEGSGPAGLDPASGQECRVRVRVRGQAQRVTLTVSLPEGTRDERVTFYRDARLDTQRIAVVGPARLEPGEHELRWDGRDRSRAQRIALSGAWTLSVQSAEREGLGREAVTAEVQVARPRYQPFWPWFGGSGVIPAGGLHRLGLDMAKRYDAAPMMRFANQGQFVSVLREAAVGVMLTHGDDGQVGLGTWTKPQPILVSTDIQGKPFKDVHALFIYSCRSGVGPLPKTLLDAGVDVVVMSTETLLKVEADPYLGSLGFRLLGYGLPISRANADAAAFAHSVIWEPLNWAARAYLRDWKGIRSTQEGMKVWVAPGIEEATEKLVPARHGNSRN